MSIQVRINRDKNKHRWTIWSLTHAQRLGHAESLLLRGVTFVRESDCGWADGELWSWAAIQVDPKFHERVEARTVENLALTWWPLKFKDGEFYLDGLVGPPLARCSWLRIRGNYAEVAEPVEQD
jgi:hypothetical protein